MQPSTFLEIDLKAIQHNISEIKKRICPRVLAVVKSNAYGHGATEIVKTLNDSVIGFMVDNISEALEIKDITQKPILVMLANKQKEIEILAKNKIAFALFDFYQFRIIKNVSKKLGQKVKVHLKIDTGMNRLGFKKNNWSRLKKELYKHKNYLKISGIFSHFAKANDRQASQRQQKIMQTAIGFFKFKNCFSHFSASGASLIYKASKCDLVRPGLILYGHSPLQTINWLKPVLSFKTQIVQLKWVNPGETVGYELFFKPKRKTLIGILPVGYKDGFSRRMTFVSPKGIIRGQIYSIVSRVCMRYSYIDVTEIKNKIKVGDEVVLLGNDGNAKINVDDWAKKLDTSVYEILTQFPRDLPRIYKK